jgi:hypothetical protein
MKKISLLSLLSLSFGLFCCVCAQAQSTKPYTEGPVWQVQFVQTKSGMGQQYLKNLNDGWIKVMVEAKAEGTIMDYKVLQSEPAAKTDWDLMLLIEIKNYAGLDGMQDKMEVIRNKIFGSEDVQQKASVLRNDLRDLLGGKLARELIFK